MKELIPNSTELFLHVQQFYGVREVPGKEANPIILGWIKRVFSWATDDVIPHCSVFLVAQAQDLGLEHPIENDEHKFPYNKPGMARSWMMVGIEIPLEEAVPGDVCIFWRISPDNDAGHVALYVNHTDSFVWAYGANQRDQVNVSPQHRNRLLKTIRLRKLDQLEQDV